MRALRRADPSLLDRRWRLLRTSAEREIAAAPAEVWSVVADHTTWTSWHEDYDEHEAISDQATGLGAQFRTKEWILHSESEITRWEPETALRWQVVRARGLRWLISSYEAEITIEPIAGDPQRCRVRYRAALAGTVVFWLLAAYTIAYSLGGIYVDARSSLKRLDQYLAAHAADAADPGG